MIHPIASIGYVVLRQEAVRRVTVLGVTVACGILALAPPRAIADCDTATPVNTPAGTERDVTCTGDENDGVESVTLITTPNAFLNPLFVQPITLSSLTVTGLTTDIAPASGQEGIRYWARGRSGSALIDFSLDPPVQIFPPGLGGQMNLLVDSARNITTQGASGIEVFSIGGDGWVAPDSGALSTSGNDGGPAAAGGNVTATICALDAQSACDADPGNRMTITTEGGAAHGIHARSQGGTGGKGENTGGVVTDAGDGGNGSAGGTVNLTSSANISTHGDLAYGIFAESLGGNGGNGGTGGALLYSGGGDGGAAGAGGTVVVNNFGNITTNDSFTTLIPQTFYREETIDLGGITFTVKLPFPEVRFVLGPEGDGSHGIYARSRGGRGGNGQTAGGLISASGDGGGSGRGGNVTVFNAGDISVAGNQSRAIFAESIGGGGGDAGYGIGFITIGGDAQSGGNGGNVTVTNAGRISTGAAGASERELADMYGGQGIFAQSVGGGGGNGGDALSFAPIFALGIGGDAGGGGDGGTVTVTSIGASHTPDGEFDISTGGSYSHGIHAQSVGGGGGTGGGAIAIAASVPKVPINLAVAIGGAGGDGGDGEQVTVINQSTIGTAGAKAYGVLAQSIGGGGGDGGYSVAAGIATTQQVGNVAVAVGGSGAVGGDGGGVTVISTGAVQTEGQKSHGIAAQSIGGGGGNGGFAVAGTASFNNAAPVDLSVAVGGSGGRGGDGGLVTVVNAGDIETKSTPLPEAGVVGPYACGPDSGTCEAEDPVQSVGGGSIGILAQSIGGGGGDGGYSFAGSFGLSKPNGTSVNVAIAVGGAGGDGGTSGRLVDDGNGNLVLEAVSVTNTGNISTWGTDSHGILAQSVSKGGGNGGSSTAVGLGFGGRIQDAWNVNLAAAVGGAGGDGSAAGNVDVVNTGNITTREKDSRGIYAQSVGGGGGNGGTSFTATIGLAAASEGHTANGRITVGGSGGSGNSGGDITVENSGAIVTSGDKSDGIFAHSIGGGGGNGGKASGFSLRLEQGLGAAAIKKPGTNWNAAVTVGGSGGYGNQGGEVVVNNSGAITTGGNFSRGIFAQSIGGGGGNGGEGNNGTGIAILDGLITVLDSPGGTGPAACQPGAAGSVVEGAKAICKFFSKKALGQLRDWTFTVGGDGGISGDGNDVTVTNSAAITTTGMGSDAIFAQSVGGGGGVAQSYIAGNSGFDNTRTGNGAVSSVGLTGKIGIGGAGGAAGDGGDVFVDNQADLRTEGEEATGIFAQSVGGGGGVAGNVDRFLATDTLFGDVPVLGEISGDEQATLIPRVNIGIGLAFGRDGGGAGNGGDVTVINTGNISTIGSDAHGIWAQSVGGGGGRAGGLGNDDFVLTSFAGSVGGHGSAGQIVVEHNGGTIRTSGEAAHGIFAQSVGGQGKTTPLDLFNNLRNEFPPIYAGVVPDVSTLEGEVGFALFVIAEEVEAFGDTLPPEVLQAYVDGRLRELLEFLPEGDIKSYMDAVLNGLSEGSAVNISVAGDILVTGAGSHGIFAQSLGGDGNGNISIDVAGTVQGGSGSGVGVYFDQGVDNSLTIAESGVVSTSAGWSGLAIRGGFGNETVNNAGTVVGSINLGFGDNAFNNLEGASLLSGTSIFLGPGNLLSNAGTISPGDGGQLLTTFVFGDYAQSSTGRYLVDVDYATSQADWLIVAGTSALAGQVEINGQNADTLTPGSSQVTIFTSAGGISGTTDLELVHPESVVVDYELLYPDPFNVQIGYSVDFAPVTVGPEFDANRGAFGDYVNRVQAAGGFAAFRPLIGAFVSYADIASLGEAYDQLIPESIGNLTTETVATSVSFNGNLHSCRQRDGDYRFIREGKCSWMRIDFVDRTHDETPWNPGYTRNHWSLAFGKQFEIGSNSHFGMGASFRRLGPESSVIGNDGRQLEAGLIVKHRIGPAMLSGSVTAGRGWFDTGRLINQIGLFSYATGEQDMEFGSVHGQASFEIGLGENAYLRPILDLGYTRIRRDGFTEADAGAANLVVDGEKDSFTTFSPALEFGGEFSTASGTAIRPYLRVGSLRYLTDNRSDVTARLLDAPTGVAPFTITTVSDRSFAEYSLGLHVVDASGFGAQLAYQGQRSDNTHSEAATLKIYWPF